MSDTQDAGPIPSLARVAGARLRRASGVPGAVGRGLREVRTFSAMNHGLLVLRDRLSEDGITRVGD